MSNMYEHSNAILHIEFENTDKYSDFCQKFLGHDNR